MKLDSPLFAGSFLVGAIVLLWTMLLVAKRVLGARILAAAQLTRTMVDDLVVHLISLAPPALANAEVAMG